MSQITINVCGKYKIGKSTIAQIIFGYLKNLGLNVELNDSDNFEGIDELPQKIESLRENQRLITINGDVVTKLADT